jgi:hypothetical protein
MHLHQFAERQILHQPVTARCFQARAGGEAGDSTLGLQSDFIVRNDLLSLMFYSRSVGLSR